MSSTSLDDLLREIEQEQGKKSPSALADSAGLADLPTHETAPHRTNSSPFIVPEMIGQIPQLTHEMMGGGKVVGEQMIAANNLSERQRRLPKISLHMVGSVLAVFVLMIGLGSSVLLSQQGQDTRQQAYQGEMGQQAALESSESEMTQLPADSSDTVLETSQQTEIVAADPWWRQPMVIGGAAVILSAVLLLAIFFHWLFAV